MKKSLRILAAGFAPLPILAGVVLAGTSTANAATSLVAVPNSVNPAIAHSTRVGEVAANNAMSVTVSLTLRNQAGLNSFLSQVTDPKSAEYHHFLTPAQFTAQYGPSASEVNAVTAFLASHGLKVAAHQANSQVLQASGTAGQLERTFDTTLGVYSQGGRQYYANETTPALPASVAGSVAGVVGLDNHAVFHTDNKKADIAPSASVQGLTPAKIKSGYSMTTLGTGTGKSVALWEFDGFKQSYITTYDNNFSLGSKASTTVSVDGANYNSSPGDGEPEVELDIEIVQGVAPAVSTYVYEAPNSDQGQIDMAAKIASDHKVDVTSISWGECEADSSAATITSTHNALAQGVAEGITFYSASGDSGSADCGSGAASVDYPASDPDVSGTGGTTLTLTSAGAWSKETAWSGSGGGVSKSFAGRDVPDVAADANPSTGYAVYSQGAWAEYGGTSCAAPVWSGLTALIDSKAGSDSGNLNSTFTSIGGGSGYSASFHDITSGSNGSFKAGTGRDEVTGWGSPIGSGLYTAIKG